MVARFYEPRCPCAAESRPGTPSSRSKNCSRTEVRFAILSRESGAPGRFYATRHGRPDETLPRRWCLTCGCAVLTNGAALAPRKTAQVPHLRAPKFAHDPKVASQTFHANLGHLDGISLPTIGDLRRWGMGGGTFRPGLLVPPCLVPWQKGIHPLLGWWAFANSP